MFLKAPNWYSIAKMLSGKVLRLEICRTMKRKMIIDGHAWVERAGGYGAENCCRRRQGDHFASCRCNKCSAKALIHAFSQRGACRRGCHPARFLRFLSIIFMISRSANSICRLDGVLGAAVGSGQLPCPSTRDVGHVSVMPKMLRNSPLALGPQWATVSASINTSSQSLHSAP